MAMNWKIDNSVSMKILGIQYRGLGECLTDGVNSFMDHGLLPSKIGWSRHFLVWSFMKIFGIFSIYFLVNKFILR
jgi:hypothetical protein